MNADESRAVVGRFYDELWNGRALDVADEIFAPDCITHQLQSGAEIAGAPRDAEAVKQHVAEWLQGFPDLRFEVEQLLADEGTVMSRAVMHGTHKGTWHGIAPTGKRVSIRMIVVHRIVAGRIAEDWVLVEALGFFQQLGLVAATQEILANASR
jgi:steroid delta-isomerase-like uncharacterized protein